MRYGDWKVSFKFIDGNLFTGKVQEGNVPLVVNLRQDPFERYPVEASAYAHWWGEKLWTLVPAAAITGKFLATFQEYPPSQPTGSLGATQFLQAFQAGAAGSGEKFLLNPRRTPRANLD